MTPVIRVAQQLLEEQGFLVLAFLPGPKPIPKIGDVITEAICDVPGPFFVVAESSAEEYQQQAQAAHQLDPSVLAIGLLEDHKHRALGFFRLIAE